MKAFPYRYVQVVTSILGNGTIAQLIGTTDSEDKRDGLDILILRHRQQLKDATVQYTMIGYLSANGEMSADEMPLHSEGAGR